MLLDYKMDPKNGLDRKLQAALYLPANYEKGKRYPTLVYYYEKMSSQLNRYAPPTSNGFNKSVYTSNGYAVLIPDITYKINDPGMSAVWCVLPALDAAVATGVVDRSKVGLQGHSWGGYQTAFLVTQADFAAAVAGAPLTNMISMYSSIYFNSGSANQPIFETSQGRFKGGYWDNLEAYQRNSPVYYAQNVHTPLMILHNDKDGAVVWNQGIEYYNTLRRLKKPVIMLEYVGENHGLAKPANQKDYTVRMKEFFDHYLMGKAAPKWMIEGIPYLKLKETLKEQAKLLKPAEKKEPEKKDEKK
jgi:dipeptidyl aminopeptidase/acylaminoacyl peptidase